MLLAVPRVRNKIMSIVTESSDVKRKISDLESFAKELRGYL